jgi:hypothetical protein
MFRTCTQYMSKRILSLAGRLTLILMLPIVLQSCKKDKEGPAELTELQLLTQHDWRLGKMYFYYGGVLDDSLSSPCEVDDTYRFHPTKFIVLDNAVKCDSTEPDSTIVDMVYLGNHIFTLMIDGDTTLYSITKVTNDTLKFQGNQDGETLKATFLK